MHHGTVEGVLVGFTGGCARAATCRRCQGGVKDVTEPHLMMFAEDEAAAGRKLSSSSGGPHELVLVPGSVGGAELLAGSTGTESAREVMLDFLQQHSGS